jgi:hypothetical protein
MEPKFLREEAARFRGMAESQDREASKLRLLKMAADYEAKAEAADELTEQSSAKATGARVTKKTPTQESEAV